jgi:hypothetical protein
MLVFTGGGAVGDELSPAVVGESGVRKGQQAECCEIEMHDGRIRTQWWFSSEQVKARCGV